VFDELDGRGRRRITCSNSRPGNSDGNVIADDFARGGHRKYAVGCEPSEGVLIHGVILSSIEIEIVPACRTGIEGDVPNLHSMKDAAVAGTDGYEGACPEGSCSNDFGFGPRGNGSRGPTRIIDFHYVRAPQVDGALDPERTAHRIFSWFD